MTALNDQTPVTAFTRSGDNGSARKRLPVSLNTALPTQRATSDGKFVARVSEATCRVLFRPGQPPGYRFAHPAPAERLDGMSLFC